MIWVSGGAPKAVAEVDSAIGATGAPWEPSHGQIYKAHGVPRQRFRAVLGLDPRYPACCFLEVDLTVAAPVRRVRGCRAQLVEENIAVRHGTGEAPSGVHL